MSRGGAIIEDVVSPLLKQVAEAKCLLASKRSRRTNNGFSAVDGLLGGIEGEVLLIKESFQRLEMWMKDVENELGVVAKQIDNILEGTTGRRVFNSELQNIHKNISVLREHVTGPLDQLLYCNTSNVNPAPCKGSVVNSLPSTELHSVMATRWFEVAKKYEKISPILRRCLLTFAIFPHYSIIEKRLLIHWWVGEGLVTPTINHTAEEFGERCIRDLIAEGLILPVNRAHSSEVTHYRVQSWVREEVIILAMLSKAFSFYGSGELMERLSSSPRTCLTEPPTTTEQYALKHQGMLLATCDFNPDNFTTCFNVDRRNLRFKKKEFMSMRNATVLQLGS
ncbi:hypothetical protein J5N97_011893 [Dioscorea zingiberensis]|uniref:Disease resistance protein winged helix domain-containing protein n=1 Tax=Dioscorea zingiberensis TaxID=325984 RepID=A0A9D5D204_9LILI|nr:hypothetical protein J5N97_011893 [Dioscorea zingiberensis]